MSPMIPIEKKPKLKGKQRVGKQRSTKINIYIIKTKNETAIFNEYSPLLFKILSSKRDLFLFLSGSLWHEEISCGIQQKDNENVLLVGEP